MSNPIDPTDTANVPDDPQFSANQRAGAIAIMLSVMAICLFIIIAWWPADPTADKNAVYYFKPFHVRLVSPPTAPVNTPGTEELSKKAGELTAEITKLGKATDSISVKTVTADKKALIEVQAKLKAATIQPSVDAQSVKDCRWTIQLGSLILILVAACGFLGNLIHVSRSLTYYIGMNLFQKSWIPWYFIKPFTASGLALLIYFATNSSGSAATGPINLFPIMLAAALAGLFTDIATQKLKVIFEAILKPADTTRPPLTPAKTTSVDMTKLTPGKITLAKVNNVSVPGQNLNPQTVTVMVDNQVPANLKITANLITFDVDATKTPATKTQFVLTITDKTVNLNETNTWQTISAPPQGSPAASV